MPKTDHYQWYTEQFAPTELHAHAIEETYFAGRTPFQSVAVFSTPMFGKMLVLDGDTQSSQADEKIYHESLVHPAMAAVDDRRDVLILGGGEGATLREVLRDPAVRRCTMVDIDGQVVELSKKYLPEWSDGAFDDPRARVLIGDALQFIKEDGDRYGVVISDLTDRSRIRRRSRCSTATCSATSRRGSHPEVCMCCKRPPLASTTWNCTRRWPDRFARISSTFGASTRTSHRSITTGHSSHAVTARTSP